MRDIVATIQAEQDEIIRLDHPEVLVIEGGPGTGKTVVALHRVILLGVLRPYVSPACVWRSSSNAPSCW
jgi:superfamily I DNA/RNA helicase